MELLSRRPAYAPLLHEDIPRVSSLFQEGNTSPFYKRARAFTAFGLDEFKERAERDGAVLVILVTHSMYYGARGRGVYLLNEMAAERRIPVINQADVIYRQGAELRDAEWAHDGHWNSTGHQWAAEALLEYLKRMG